MLADSLVEEFEIREDEPWYDQQDLQQGVRRGACGEGVRGSGGRRAREPRRGGPGGRAGGAGAAGGARGGGGARCARGAGGGDRRYRRGAAVFV